MSETIETTCYQDLHDVGALASASHELREQYRCQIDHEQTYTLRIDGEVVAIYGAVPDYLQQQPCLSITCFFHAERAPRCAYRVMKTLVDFINLAKRVGDVTALIDPTNDRMQRVAERLGAKKVAIARVPIKDDKQYEVYLWQK